MVLCCIMGVAKGESSQTLPDSVVTEDNVYRYMFSDTKKAEAIMEALRERKKMSGWELDYTEGDLWFNTGRYFRALKYYTRVLESDQAKKDNTLLVYYEKDHRGEDALRTFSDLEKVATASTGQEKSIGGLDEKEQKAFYGHRTVVYDILGRDAEADESYLKFISLGKPTDRDKEQIRRLVHEIDSRKLYLTADLTQKDVLEFVQIPAYRFGAVFKKHAGTSFSDYINSKRMGYAVKLLTEHPEYTIEAVAGMCGIKSKQHFHRQFAAYTGLTPATFRHSNEKIGNQ